MIVDVGTNHMPSTDTKITVGLEYVLTRAEDILETVTLFDSNPEVVDVVVSLEDDDLIHMFVTAKPGHDLGKMSEKAGLMLVNAVS